MKDQEKDWGKEDMLQEILDAAVDEFFSQTANPKKYGDNLNHYLKGEQFEGDARLLLFPPNEKINITRWTFIKSAQGMIGNLADLLPPGAASLLENEWDKDVDVLVENPQHPAFNAPSDIPDAKESLIRALNNYYYWPEPSRADFLSICVKLFGKSVFSYIREQGLIVYKLSKDEMDDLFYMSLRKLDFYRGELQSGYARFFESEFETIEAERKNLSVLRLCEAIGADMPNFTFTPGNALERLNGLLEVTSLHDEIRKRKPCLIVSREIESRHELIMKKIVHISKKESDILEMGEQDPRRNVLRSTVVQSRFELKDLVGRFNRLLLEQAYPAETPPVLRLTHDERCFVKYLADTLRIGYEDYIDKEGGIKKKDVRLVTSMVSPPEWRSIIENMILKDAVICPYNYKGEVCGKLFLRSKKSNRAICYEHSKNEYQTFIRSLKPHKQPAGGFRPGSGRPRKGSAPIPRKPMLPKIKGRRVK